MKKDYIATTFRYLYEFYHSRIFALPQGRTNLEVKTYSNLLATALGIETFSKKTIATIVTKTARWSS
jgi:hypothetical protein